MCIYIYIDKEREKGLRPRIFNSRVHGTIIFGHVHIAKTAGTTLNGQMAAKFERVCGHKGYSYDSWQDNYRRNQSESGVKIEPDSMSKLHQGFSRSRVHPSIMTEIGYEDCDYISHEINWNFWPRTFQHWRVPIELHIPCRDPISHLMSMCNYRGRKFNCTNDLETEIQGCLTAMNRFDSKLTTGYTNIIPKCFPAQAIDKYIEFMSYRLQKKQFPVEYIFRATNAPRSAETECIWSNNTALSFAKRYLGDMQYYKYCASCLGSDKDLLHSW